MKATAVTAMGVDVSLARGLDVVVLGPDGAVAFGPSKVALDELGSVIRATRPAVVAIDGPPAWARSGRSRAIERQLLRLGISIYSTPAEAAGRPFYAWMEIAIKVFGSASAEGYPTYSGLRIDGPQSIEVFPHASAVSIIGCLPPAGVRKVEFRRMALEREGACVRMLRTADQVDAALAALTGLRFLQGSSCDVGVPGDAVLVLPVRALPDRYRKRVESSETVVESSFAARVRFSGNAKQPSRALPDSGLNLEHTKKFQEDRRKTR
ncbi:MAG TPA: DUF429 domain-containing protein [Candidatus Udaeobacter sp.]|nr:DUF429 domain-containing protein [Candidatus Udaeobacter sp.]